MKLTILEVEQWNLDEHELQMWNDEGFDFPFFEFRFSFAPSNRSITEKMAKFTKKIQAFKNFFVFC